MVVENIPFLFANERGGKHKPVKTVSRMVGPVTLLLVTASLMSSECMWAVSFE